MDNKFSDKERKYVETTLKKYKTDKSINSIIELEGLLSGILALPKPYGLEDTFDLIWGENDKDKPEWESKKEVETFVRSIFALSNKNNLSLRGSFYRPKLLKNKDDIKLWAKGYIQALGLNTIKADLTDDDVPIEIKVSLALLIMIYNVTEDTLNIEKDLPNVEELKILCDNFSVAKFSECIHDIYKYYRQPEESISESKSPKRNDSCLCGSGKKFKHCCLH